MTRRRVAVLLTAGLWLVSGCHKVGASQGEGAPASDVDADSDTDGDTDGDTDTGTDIPGECATALVPDCEEAVFELPLIVAASEFGDDVLFVDATATGILAERNSADGTELLVITRDDDDWIWGEAGVATTSIGDGHGVAISGSDDYYEQHFVVLACGDYGGSCHLFGASPPNADEPDIWPLAGGELSSDYEARGLGSPFEGWPLVVGDGVWLHADELWYELVSAGSGALFNDAMDQIAAGDEGRLTGFGTYGEPYHDYEPTTDADLLAFAGWPTARAIGAADGALGLWTTMPDLPEPPEWTAVASEPIVDVAKSSLPGGTLYALTESGCVIGEHFEVEEGPCVEAVIPGEGLAIVPWTCGVSSNVSYLTPKGLYGNVQCYEI